MSSNIGPEAQAAYQKYLDASNIDEKIKRLEEFISLIPKHKATENIVALNKSRLAKLKKEQEERKARLKSTSKVVSPFSIKKEGIQLILISDYYIPGVGKTSLLNFLTHAAKEKIGKFTAIPEIGIYEFENIRFQIVDMPSLMEGASIGVGNGKEILSQLRSCDLICICADLTRDYKNQLNLILAELNSASIKLNAKTPPISIEKTGSNKIQVFYLTRDSKKVPQIKELTENIKKVVFEGGLRNVVVKIFGRITIADVVDALDPSIVFKKAIIIGTKGDLPSTEDNFESLKNDYSNRFEVIIGSSVKKKEFPENFGNIVLDTLDKIRIFTMHAGRVAEKPLIMNKGSLVKDVALKIHRSFYDLFDYAIVIRKGARQKKKRVGLDYHLKNNDIIEIHTI